MEQVANMVKAAEAQAKKNHQLLADRQAQAGAPADRTGAPAAGTGAPAAGKEPLMYTVLFLDEVNTTEALGLVKEVLCDGTLNGEPLDMDSGLRLVAACNPYKM